MNFANHVDFAARNAGDAVAVGDGDRTWTFEALAEASDRVADALSREGVAPADVVAIALPNGVEFLAVYLGTMKCGAVASPVNARFTDQQRRYVLRDGDAVALVTDGDDAPDAGDPRTYTPSELVAAGDPDFDVVPRRSDERAELLYSSGTTGAPKGVYHTHGNLEANALGFVRYLEWTRDDVAMTACRCFHVTGLNVTTTPFLLLGAPNHLLAEWDVEAALSTVESRAVTYTFLVPSMLMDLLESGRLDSYDLSSLRTVGVGGSPMPAERIEAVERRLGCRLLEGYGMTETTPLAAFNRPVAGGRRPGSVGRPAAELVELRVEDPDTGEALPPGELGELCWRGDTVTPGYTSARLTDERFVERDGERWLRSGDVGRCDDDGFLYVVDRIEDMFTTGCGNVYPRRIEAVIYGLDPVERAAVIDTRDDVRGATVTALVKCREGATVDPDAIRRACARDLESHEVPDRIEFVDDLPRTPTGKLDRVALRRRFGRREVDAR